MPYTREQRLAAKRRYREANREELAAKQRAYNAEHREECNKRSLEYQRNNPERRTRYRAENKEQINKKNREWTAKNREKINAKQREWNAANKDKLREYRQKNREERLAKQRAYQHANKDKIRSYYTRPDVRARSTAYNREFYAKYPEKKALYQRNATAKERAELEALAGRPRPTMCEVCGRPNKSGRALHFDHCHQRGHFRGWLCNGCNAALGLVNDDPAILRKLIVYLERTKDGTGAQLTLSGV
jgi:hypothetical protein